MIHVLSIVGATASGKTNLSLELAKSLDGEIVSCDSVQIYKYFDILSAKPSKNELAEVPHHLIDCLEPTELCNAGFWKNKAIEIVQDIHNRGKVPIIVGGTGLYLKALYLGMFEQESRDQEYREFLQKNVEKNGLDDLYQKLLLIDKDYALKISENDQLRIVRALEVFHVTKIKFSELHKHNVKPNWNWTFVKPQTSREDIYKNIEQRIYQMQDSGMIEEVKNLLLKYGPEIAPLKTIGYRHVCEYLEGKYDQDEMLQKLILDTRHFAKRQETLFRSLIPNELFADSNIIIKKGLNYG